MKAPNVLRLDTPDLSTLPWTGIMRDLDDLVERVLKAHFQRLESKDSRVELESRELVA